MRKLFSALVGIIVIAVMLAGCTGTATTSATKSVSPAATSAAPQASTSAVPSPSTSAPPPAKPPAASPAPSSPASSAAPTTAPGPTTAPAAGSAYSQYKRTVGLMKNDSAKSFNGYTLFAPKHTGTTYLINNKGELVNKWSTSQYEPGQTAYLRENGNLIRAALKKGAISTGGGEGGRIEEYDWNGKLVWATDFSTDKYLQSYDFTVLPNGNILLVAVEKKTYAEAIQAGFDPKNLDPKIQQQNFILPGAIYEIKPKMPEGSEIVWEWHTWDHLVQNFDKTKDNYAVPSEHPELVNVNVLRAPYFWNHIDAISYNAKWDQIMVTVRGNNEIWIIDHSTNTAQAKDHTGGKYNKGGDLLYRWGNPLQYGAGTQADQKYFQPHSANWIDDNMPGGGNILVFNNSPGPNYSTVDEFKPAVDAKGTYSITPGQAFGPKDFTWTYKANPPESMFDRDLSSAQRLPNGNTLIDSGTHGRFIEVTPTGEIVWEYINPVTEAPIGYADPIPVDPNHPLELNNVCFKVVRYGPDFAGFKGKDMTAKGFIETDTPPKTAPAAQPKPPAPGGQPPPPPGGQQPPPPGGQQPPPPGGAAAPAPGPTAAPGATAPNPAPKSTGTMKLTSSVVKDGGDMPEKYTRQGAKNGITTVSPPLAWTGAPAGTQSFAIIGWNGVIFWSLWNIPGTTTSLPEDVKGIGIEGQKFQTPSEGGPGTFVKHITLYALSANVNVPAGADVETLRKALNAITLDSAELKYNVTVQ